MLSGYLVLLPVLVAGGVSAVGTAFGYATGTTGGGSAKPAEPTSAAQLVSWLADSTPRVILLSKTYDFKGTSISGAACSPWNCAGSQVALNANNWCGTLPTTTVTYDAAGPSAIPVGSNKTLLGVGTSGGLRGRGLILTNSRNVIIQNIRIFDINPRVVWGGDAISISGGDYIWIDHNYIQNIGRQFFVTHYNPGTTHLTISNNILDGRGDYSASCNGRHYWVALLTGQGDQITMALNHFFYTSGRGPHVGGTSGYTQKVHLYNNLYASVAGHAIDAGVGANVLSEGNFFNTVTTPDTGGVGNVYLPLTSADASACTKTIGRACVTNSLLASGAVNRLQTATLSAFADTTVKGVSIMSASAAATYVQANAGLGKVN